MSFRKSLERLCSAEDRTSFVNNAFFLSLSLSLSQTYIPKSFSDFLSFPPLATTFSLYSLCLYVAPFLARDRALSLSFCLGVSRCVSLCLCVYLCVSVCVC